MGRWVGLDTERAMLIRNVVTMHWKAYLTPREHHAPIPYACLLFGDTVRAGAPFGSQTSRISCSKIRSCLLFDNYPTKIFSRWPHMCTVQFVFSWAAAHTPRRQAIDHRVRQRHAVGCVVACSA